MVGSGRVSRVWNFMTRPIIKKKFVTQPNPTHQAIKTDPTRRVWSGQVGFGGSAG